MAIFHTAQIQAGIRQRSLRKHCRVGRATELVFVLATGVMLTVGGAAQAQVVWEGNVNTRFENDGNWVGGTAPGSTDDVTIDDSSNNSTQVFVNADVANIIISGTGDLNIRPGVSLDSSTTVETGGTLTVRGTHTGDISAEDGASVTVVNGGLVSGTLTNAATGSLNAGTVNALDNDDGTFTNNGTVTTTTTVDGGTVTNSGTMTGLATVNNGGTLSSSGSLDGGATNNSGGTLNITAGTAGDVINAGTGTNAGTINSLDNDGGTFDNSGTVTTTTTVDGGTVTNSGTMTGLATVNNSGTVSSSGSLDGGATNNAGGTLNITGGTSGAVTSAGTLELSGGTTASVTQSAGSATAFGNAIVSGATAINGGSLEVNGTFTSNTLTTAGDVNVVGGGNLIAATTVQSGGDLNISSISTHTGNVVVDSGGIFDTLGTMNGTVDNSGTARIRGGTSGDVTNAGSLELSGGTTDSVTQSAGSTTVTGAATVTGLTDINGGSLTVNAGQTLTATGGIDIANGLTATINGTVETAGASAIAGTVNGSGTLNVTGDTTTVTGDVNTDMSIASGATGVNDGNVEDVANAGTFTNNGGAGAITNTGALTLNASTSASVTQNTEAGATTTVDGAATVTGLTDIDTGSLTIKDTLTAEGNIDIAADGVLTVAGGGAVAAGTGTGSITNASTALSSNAGTVLDITNSGLFSNSGNAGAVGNSGTFTNTGTVASLINSANEFTNDGGTITGTASVTGGTLDVNGGMVGATTNSGGIVELSGGATIASLTQSGGTLTTIDGPATVTGLTDINSGTLDVQSGQTLTATGGVDMAGGTTLNLTGTVDGAVNSAGTIDVSNGAVANTGTVTGNLDSTGPINLSGNVNNQLSIGGAGDLSGTVTVDLDATGATGVIGTIDSTGDLTGNVSLSLGSSVGTTTSLDGVVIASSGGSNTLGASFTNAFRAFLNPGLNLSVTNDGTNLQFTETVSNSVNSVAATVGLSQTLVNTVVNRPTSPFVADLAAGAEEDPCGPGVWTRITGGTAEADGTFIDVQASETGESPVSLNYYGLQFGGDFACFGGHYNGWDLAFGGIGGFNIGDSTSTALDQNGILEGTLSTDFTQSYVGVYMTAARGRFFADLQYRYEDTSYDSTNVAPLGSSLDSFETEYDNKGQTLSGAVGYSWQVANNPGLTFVSSAGFSLSRNETDDVVLGTGGTLTFEDGDSNVGFLSASIANTVIRPDEISLLSYFGTATLYNDFASDRTVFFDSGSGARELAIENLGSYGEVSVGVNYLTLLSPGQAGNARQLNASVRVDARFSSDIESYGITGQLRLQW